MNERAPERVARMMGSRAARAALAALSGAALPLAFAPFGLFWVAPVSYALLFLAWRGAAPRQAYLLGLCFGLASFLAGVHWVYVSMHEYGQMHPMLAATMTALFVAVLALFPAAAGLIAAWLRGTDGARAWLVSLPALWVLVEWARGWLFTGFGWLSAGYSQSDSWLSSLAPIGGLHAMSWAALLSAGALLTLVLGPRRRDRVAAACAALALWGGAWAIGDLRFTRPQGDDVTVALVQGAVPQDLKWRPEQLDATLAVYRDLTAQAAGNALIVWPEAAIPALYDHIVGYLDNMAAQTAERGSTVVLGVLIGTPDDFQNAVIALTDPRQVYTKRHLVPFGEYFPVPSFVREWLRLMSLPYTDATPGPAGQPPLEAAGQRLAITICYEAVFGAEQLHSLPDATLLVNVSNDAWFGDSIGPHQHLQIARIRAAEAGRYMLRAANTGITAVIDPQGGVAAQIPQFEAGVLTDVVRGFAGSTPYAVVGNYPTVLGALILVLLAGWRAREPRARRFEVER